MVTRVVRDTESAFNEIKGALSAGTRARNYHRCSYLRIYYRGVDAGIWTVWLSPGPVAGVRFDVDAYRSNNIITPILTVCMNVVMNIILCNDIIKKQMNNLNNIWTIIITFIIFIFHLRNHDGLRCEPFSIIVSVNQNTA